MTIDAQWLERALHGNEYIPQAGPGEDPEHGILRMDPLLHPALREACETLVLMYVADPIQYKDQDGYVSSLLYLVNGLGMVGVSHLLCSLVDREQPLISVKQQTYVLGTLVDLRVPLSIPFWKGVVAHSPDQLATFALSALLQMGAYRQALEILPSLLDDEVSSDAVYVILTQWVEHG